MSKPYYEHSGGLRFWNESEILKREQIIESLSFTVKENLIKANRAWLFERIEGPILTPSSMISESYTEKDIFKTQHKYNGNEDICLRAETTASTYAYAKHNVKKPPICFWQVGKSFRRELSDGARASKLRFNEFYQIEFQCLFSEGTMADYRALIIDSLVDYVSSICSGYVKVVKSDRLPSYSESTLDIEVDGMEVASISYRNDYVSKKIKVLEIAFGLDRLVELSR
jgi:glycyl-tRNA synthetase